jgi:hypothetical protein
MGYFQRSHLSFLLDSSITKSKQVKLSRITISIKALFE